MPLPILLGLAALGVAGHFGKDFLERSRAEEKEAERAGDMLAALRAATVAVPGSEVGPYGPERPDTRLDLALLAEGLLEAGDPTGLNVAMQAAAGRTSAAAGAAEAEDRFALEVYKQREQNKRHQATLQAQARQAQLGRQAGFMPTFHAPGSKGHSDLVREGFALKNAGSILQNFQRSMQAFGTESWGELSGQLASERQQLMLFLKQAEGTGTIDEGTLQLFDQLMPDPTKLTSDVLNTEAGKLNSLINLFNDSYLPSYNVRSSYSTQVPQIGAVASERLTPEGWVPVSEEQLAREAELQENLLAEQLEREHQERMATDPGMLF